MLFNCNSINLAKRASASCTVIYRNFYRVWTLLLLREKKSSNEHEILISERAFHDFNGEKYFSSSKNFPDFRLTNTGKKVCETRGINQT